MSSRGSPRGTLTHHGGHYDTKHSLFDYIASGIRRGKIWFFLLEPACL